MKIVRRTAQCELMQGIDPLLAKIYAHRNVSDPKLLERGLGNLVSPVDLPDIQLAANRLADAIENGEHILIVGDFDADGATSVALCKLILDRFGAAQVNYLVPNRFEFGYGLSPEIVDLAQSLNPQVIVTVDNGVASVAGVARANEYGIDVIVTDHHLPGEQRPDCLALVNPNLPESHFSSKSMAGVGVAYYVMSALRSELRRREWFVNRDEPNLADYLDLVALGTVADVVPLDANNRRLVHQGIARMRAGRCRPGIKALVEIGKRQLAKLGAQDLGFVVGPRLNAAGRLEDMAIGIKCLLADTLGEARSLAQALDQLNRTRRELEADMVGDAELLLATDAADDSRVGLCVYHESFHQGVVGIVAGRLRERFNKPAIVFADAGSIAADELKGSARSIDGLHIRDVLDQIATQHPGLLLKFGGHAMAAGMSIKRVHFERFGVIFDKVVRTHVSDAMLEAELGSDGALREEDINLSLVHALNDGGPWGSAFPEPLFDGEFEVVSQRVVGQTHLKLVLKYGARVVDAIAFRQPPLPSGTERVEVAFKLQENDYGQVPTVQLVVEYLQPLA
jgi:single-stranded-DNA-specific exonuclease